AEERKAEERKAEERKAEERSLHFGRDDRRKAHKDLRRGRGIVVGTWTEARSKATFDVKKSRQDALRLRSGQAGATRERFGGGYMWQASELALVIGDAPSDASGCEIRAETGIALGGAGDE